MSTEFNVSDFTAAKAKPLPVVLLLDTSGSMGGRKIDTLNDAVRKMLGTFTKEETQASEFLVSIITFGGNAQLVQPPISASALECSNLSAGGGTPLGSALDVAKILIEDKELTPSRAYRPLVVLVSDGLPTDEWKSKLDDFVENGRSAKCDRMALGIGAEAYSGEGRKVLECFVAGTEHEVFEAAQAEEIYKFFKFVTMSVVTRSLSQNPNLVPQDVSLAPPQPATAPETATPEIPQTPTATDDEDSYW